MAKAETICSSASVALVDDDENIHLWLKDILHSISHFNFVGGFSNSAEALKGLPGLQPDLAVLDIRLPDINGVECAKRLKQSLPNMQIVMLTGTHEQNWVDASLVAGAIAFLIKPIDEDQFLATLRFAIASRKGSIPNAPKIGNDSSPEMKLGTGLPLSPREAEILKNLADGLLYKEISEKIGISYTGVHKHLNKIYKKLRVCNRSEAIRLWLETGAANESLPTTIHSGDLNS